MNFWYWFNSIPWLMSTFICTPQRAIELSARVKILWGKKSMSLKELRASYSKICYLGLLIIYSIKGIWKTTDRRRTLWPPFSFLRIGTWLWKLPSLYQVEERHPWRWKICVHKPCKTNPYILVPSSQLTPPDSYPCILSNLLKFTVSLPKRYASFLASSLHSLVRTPMYMQTFW